MYNSSKLVDGYALTSSISNNFTTDWVDVREYEGLSMTVVFTGGAPSGNLALQQSNDRQWSGGNKVIPLVAAGAENSLGAVKRLDDSAQVPTGNGTVTQTVSAAGKYILDQRLCPFGWVRLVYSASSNVNTQLDVFITIKNYQ